MKLLLGLFCSVFSLFTMQAQNSGLSTTNNENAFTVRNNSFQAFTLNKAKSNFTVKGTTTSHNWEIVSRTIAGNIVTVLNNDELKIKSINLKTASKSLKSGKKLMDKKCYKALKSEIHPTISYQLNSVKNIELIAKNSYKATLIGSLTIAGISKIITTDVKIGLKYGNRTISGFNIKGNKTLKMSDFNITPPSAFFGIIKTGNDISIVYNLFYNNKTLLK